MKFIGAHQLLLIFVWREIQFLDNLPDVVIDTCIRDLVQFGPVVQGYLCHVKTTGRCIEDINLNAWDNII